MFTKARIMNMYAVICSQPEPESLNTITITANVNTKRPAERHAC